MATRKPPTTTPKRKPFARRLAEFADQIKSGEVVACQWVKLAVERHLRDYELSRSDPNYPYEWKPALVERICGVAELLPHVKGDWAKRRELLSLEPWEIFVLGVPFGWVRRGTKLRRFREIYAEVPRKNGKSVIGAIIGNYMFIADGEYGAEIYSGATTEKQAWEVYGPARQMLLKSPELAAEAGVEIGAKNMVRVNDRSKFEPLIGNPGDGSSPSCAIIDEFHEHLTSNQYDTMITGMGARTQPVCAIITTAGSSLGGPCYDKHLQAQRVLQGVVQNDELFTIIYTIDDEDDWADPAVLPKANPNYGVSVSADWLISQQRQAVLNVEYQNRFKTKHLNVWCSAKTAAINAQQWLLCADEQLALEEFEGEQCWFALDLASRNDLTAFLILFRRRLNNAWHYYAFGRYYLPESTIEESGPNQTMYRKWANAGSVVAVDGNEIDYELVRGDVLAAASRFQVTEVVYDPWRAVHLAQLLMKEGATCVEYRNTMALMSPPFKELLSAIKSGRFHFNGDPVMTWCASNVVAKADAKDNIFPRKPNDKAEFKIDAIVAIIMALGRASAQPDQGSIEDWLNAKAVMA
jgi:phage terminase large subunit-like protein